MNASQNIIYAIDDDVAVLESLETLLCHRGFQVKTFATASAFFDQVPLDAPGCLILDIQMPTMNGIELQKQLLASDSPISVVVATGVADVATAVRVMEQGAVTLLEKPYELPDLLRALETGLSQSRSRWEKLQAARMMRSRLASLNEEESQVLACMLAGDPNKQIATELHISMRTVDRRRQMVLEKMGARSVPELALMLGGRRRGRCGGHRSPYAGNLNDFTCW